MGDDEDLFSVDKVVVKVGVTTVSSSFRAPLTVFDTLIVTAAAAAAAALDSL